ncbi:MAG: non-homologous end joining protein Ku [Methanobacteriota archaeon]
MARALWSGAIAFGLVNIPVKLFAASETKDLSFTTLHAECKTPLKRPYVCPTHNAPVESKEMVKGYEFSKGQFVLVTEEELENVPIETTKAIEVSGFVEASEISPLLRERNYYLAPVELSVKPFELFRQALLRTGKVAVARAILWKKEQLVTIGPQDGGLVLTTLLYQDELKGRPDVPATQPVVVTDDEVNLALQLVQALTTELDLSKFKDRYREALVQLIQAKVEGKEIPVVTRPEAKPTQDLMAALKASLAAAKAS